MNENLKNLDQLTVIGKNSVYKRSSLLDDMIDSRTLLLNRVDRESTRTKLIDSISRLGEKRQYINGIIEEYL